MSWNYRVVEFDDIDEGKYYEIKEVYYNDDGSLMGYCDATVGGGSLAELLAVLDAMKSDIHRSIIKEEEFHKKTWDTFLTGVPDDSTQ